MFAVAPSPAGAQAQPATMVVASTGGKIGDDIKKVFEPFERLHNVRIQWVPGVSSENVAKVAASKDRPTIDVAYGDDISNYTGSMQGLWAKIDESIVTNYKDVHPKARVKNNDGVVLGIFVTGLFYRTDAFEKKGWAAPTSWNDLLRQEFCGSIGIQHPNVSYGAVSLLMLSGGDPARVSEGIARLGAARKCIPVLEPSAQKIEEKVQLGEYVIGVHGNIRIIPLADRGVPVKFVLPSEGTFISYSTFSPVKNAPNPRLAQEFCNWLLRPDVQLALSSATMFSPTNVKVTIPDDLKAKGLLETAQLDRLQAVPVDVVSESRRNWIRQLERAMTLP